MQVTVAGGSTAVLDTCARPGVSRRRRPGAKFPRLLGKTVSEEVRAEKVPTVDNEADLMAKIWPGTLRAAMGRVGGRAAAVGAEEEEIPRAARSRETRAAWCREERRKNHVPD